MLVCKFEINWSTNKNLKSAYNISRTDGQTDGLTDGLMEGLMDRLTEGLTDGLMDGLTAFPYPPLHFAGAGDNNSHWNSLFISILFLMYEKHMA